MNPETETGQIAGIDTPWTTEDETALETAFPSTETILAFRSTHSPLTAQGWRLGLGCCSCDGVGTKSGRAGIAIICPDCRGTGWRPLGPK